MSQSITDEVETNFIATGSFSVSKDLIPVEFAAESGIAYFKKPDGSRVRIVICLEVETPDGQYQYFPAEKDMERHGFGCLDYEDLKFTKVV